MMYREFSDDLETTFSLGTRELRAASRKQELSLDSGAIKADDDPRGSDPYNTSGSFDRKLNWKRVGKR